MNCKTAQHAIQRQLDGELTPAKQKTLAAHLQHCGPCRRLQADLTTLQTTMQRLAATTRDLEQPVPTSNTASPRRIPWRSALTATAAAVALCLGTWWIIGKPHEQKEPATIVTRADNTHQQATDGLPTTDIDTPGKPSQPRVRVTVKSSTDVITVPIETDRPNVTIIWMYETTKTAQTRHNADSRQPSL